jgi:hypothetical protein
MDERCTGSWEEADLATEIDDVIVLSGFMLHEPRAKGRARNYICDESTSDKVTKKQVPGGGEGHHEDTSYQVDLSVITQTSPLTCTEYNNIISAIDFTP